MKHKRSPKQWAALAAVILLALLLIALLLTAVFGSADLFQALLVCAIAVPLLAWIYVWLYGVIRDRHTMASFDVDKGIAQSLDAAISDERCQNCPDDDAVFPDCLDNDAASSSER